MDSHRHSAQPLGIRWVQKTEDAANWWLVIVARLAPGVTPAQAQTAATLAFRNQLIHGAKPVSKESDNPEITLEPVQQGLTGQRTFLRDEAVRVDGCSRADFAGGVRERCWDFCWRARREGKKKSRCGWRWARDADAWCGSC